MTKGLFVVVTIFSGLKVCGYIVVNAWHNSAQMVAGLRFKSAGKRYQS